MIRVESRAQVFREPKQQATQGITKWFDSHKGYGFIIGPDNQDVMVYYSVIAMDGYRTLEKGSAVEYTTEEGPDGRLRATWVRPLEEA